jgi:hypothetical protein
MKNHISNYFLEKLATKVLTEFGQDLSSLNIIFPNQRSAVLFTNYLSRKAGKTIWSPKLFSISEPGGIMVLEMLEKDYSLAQISRIIEAEDAKIIALFVNRSFDNTQLNVTIKLNVSELTRITASLQRMNYQVIMSFFDKTQLDDTKDRYDLLMRFLNT